jgi:hypothetical protein
MIQLVQKLISQVSPDLSGTFASPISIDAIREAATLPLTVAIDQRTKRQCI